MQTKPLSVKRTADRTRMALHAQELILACGATFERSEGGDYPGPRCVQLKVRAPGGLCVTVEFDGDSCQPDVYVLSWHIDIGSDAQLSNAVFGGAVNPHHLRKATYIASGFEDLCAKLKSGLQKAADGSAYLQRQTCDA